MKKGLSQPGDLIFRHDGNLVVAVWQDTKPVSFLSMNWEPTDIVKVNMNRKDGSTVKLNCPSVIDVYNKYMGGATKVTCRQYYKIRMRSRKVFKESSGFWLRSACSTVS